MVIRNWYRYVVSLKAVYLNEPQEHLVSAEVSQKRHGYRTSYSFYAMLSMASMLKTITSAIKARTILI